jgi:cytochrome c oxidase cbb3-type subunit 1
MSAPQAPEPAAPVAAETAAATVEQVEESCRLPVTLFFGCGLLWLLAGSALAALASVHLHLPGFHSHCAWLSYGRSQPAAMNMLIYGFALQTGLGVGLWLLGRLGRAPLVEPLMICIAGKVWNLGVAAGVLGILLGDNSGHEWFEMPRYASKILLCSYALISVFALLTLHRRSEREMDVPQWYLLAALLWFPWIAAAANLLLHFHPVRGVLQPLVTWWYANNLLTIVLGCFALAALFHLLPALTGRPLFSRDLALFGFWTMVVSGSWCGIPSDAPLPAWIISASVAAGLAFAFPVLATATNLFLTVKGEEERLGRELPLRFLSGAMLFYLLGNALGIASSLRTVGAITRFTHFESAQTHLLLYGFFAFAMFGAVYHIAPRLARQEWPSMGLAQLHLWGALLGTVIYVVALTMGGLVQGSRWLDVSRPFTDVAEDLVPFLRLGSVGLALLVAGHAAFLLNFLWLAARCCRDSCPITAALGGASEREAAEVAR